MHPKKINDKLAMLVSAVTVLAIVVSATWYWSELERKQAVLEQRIVEVEQDINDMQSWRLRIEERYSMNHKKRILHAKV